MKLFIHQMNFLLVTAWALCGCVLNGTPDANHPPQPDWPESVHVDNADERVLTVVIALSSVLPAGVVGHAGVAVDEQYWDFGPKRVQRFQRLKSFNSQAGPWWDDPEQLWREDRTLAHVLDEIENEVHPTGSLIAVVRVLITDEQADAMTWFWDKTYRDMQAGEQRYRLNERQCASMAAWSLSYAMHKPDGIQNGTFQNRFRLVTPTRLYQNLRHDLRHTAGEDRGEQADITLWQLTPDGIVPWQRPRVWDLLGMPELPRTRIGIERLRYLPERLSACLPTEK